MLKLLLSNLPLFIDPVTNETLTNSCYWFRDKSSTLLGPPLFKEEEGEGDDSSVCSESSGLHAAYKGWYNGTQCRKAKQIP